MSEPLPNIKRPIEHHCPSCGAVMDPTAVWWWTAYGATDTENCARLLIDRYVLDER